MSLARIPMEDSDLSLLDLNLAQLFLASTDSQSTYEAVLAMNIVTNIEVTANRDNITINLKSAEGNPEMTSKIIVGLVPDSVQGEKFSCCFDKEYFFQCSKTATFIVFPYGLDTILRRLLRLFPSSSFASLNIDLDDGNEPNPDVYADLAKALEAVRVQVDHLNLKYTFAPMMEDVKPLKRIFEAIGKEFDMEEVHTMRDGSFPEEDFLTMGTVSWIICSGYCDKTDRDFNRIIRKWLNSRNTHLQFISIRTAHPPIHKHLLRGVPSVGEPLEGDTDVNMWDDRDFGQPMWNAMVRRPSDGKTAVICRLPEHFMLQIEH